MEQEQNLEFSDRARLLMHRRGLREYHVWYCRFHHKKEEEYKVGREVMWKCVLPDGRNIKVRVDDSLPSIIIVKDVFTHL